MTNKDIDLNDLGLGDGFDSQAAAKAAPPKLSAIEVELANAESNRAKQAIQNNVLAKQEQTRSQEAKPKPEPYPWLRRYIVWLNVCGGGGNLVGAVMIIFGIATMDLDTFLQGIVYVLTFSFLFVIASLVQLALDAKADLATIAQKLK